MATSIIRGTLLVTVVMLSACNDDNKGVALSGSGGTFSSGGNGAGGSNGVDAAIEWSDAEIVQTMMTANDGEIAVGSLAAAKAQNDGVVAYAQMMVTDHASMQQQLQSLANEKSITPTHNSRSQMLHSSAENTRVELEAAPAASFDGEYMQSQVVMHQEVLSLLETHLIPNATDPELKALLQSARTSVSSHLAEAQQTVSAL